MAIDGNYAQHLANGGCPALHKNGRWFCQGMQGHYDYFTSRHYAKVMQFAGNGAPMSAISVEWN